MTCAQQLMPEWANLGQADLPILLNASNMSTTRLYFNNKVIFILQQQGYILTRLFLYCNNKVIFILQQGYILTRLFLYCNNKVIFILRMSFYIAKTRLHFNVLFINGLLPLALSSWSFRFRSKTGLIGNLQ
jgi:hypothetical protein